MKKIILLFLVQDYRDHVLKRHGIDKGNGSQGSPGADKSPDDCFVATACYGADHDIVSRLRQRRDEILQQSQSLLKIVFIWLYYRANLGKIGAKILTKVPVLKSMVRKWVKKAEKIF